MHSSAAAQQLLATEHGGVLATLSVRHAGWPFASLAPYALDARGEPLLLLSSLAEHTHNLRADPRASLLVQDGRGQAGARLTLLGEVAELTTEEALADARQRYVEQHPDTAEYFSVLDFHLYVLHVRAARFIAGFGDMGWLDAADLIATH